MKVLVVEDDHELLEAVVTVLEEEPYIVDRAETGDEGFLMASQAIYDLLILDIMLPHKSGLEIIRELRENGIKTPVLLLTAKDSVEDRVRGLDAGADDYLVKPFAVEELLARLRALARRNGIGVDGDLTYGPLRLSSNAHDGFANEQALKLTIKEYELLEYLLRNSEQILTRDQILDRIWGFDSEATASVVDVYVHYLRKKLACYGCEELIQTVRGVGYILRESNHV